MFARNTLAMVATTGLAMLGMAGCGRQDDRSPAEPALETAPSGTLVFTANGEDFIREGLVDKHGWQLTFTHAYVNIVDPTAYGEPGEATLNGAHWIDLAASDETAPLIVLGRKSNLPPGNYQSLRFAIRRRADGPYQGASMALVGQAEKEGQTLPFDIRFAEEMVFDGVDGYVGDEVKGLLPPDGVAEVEMTFHFDHIFGDTDAAADDHVNAGAVGFEFFRQFAEDGRGAIAQEAMTTVDAYPALLQAIWNLGHLGEGHCECINPSSADWFDGNGLD